MIAHVRVDNRLVHGQVVNAWVPHLRARRVVVADPGAAGSPLVRAAMALAAPEGVAVEIHPPAEVDWAALHASREVVLVLFRDVSDASEAYARGLPRGRLVLGNVHAADGRRAVTPSVFLSHGEVDALEALAASGVQIDAQAVPQETPLPLPEVARRARTA
jgi:mannose/fructose/N-acetylgalactosamine-specific phosphotransferase system component IIB